MPEPSSSNGTLNYQIGELRVDTGKLRVTRNGTTISLPRLSYRMLLCLADHAPNAVSIDQLMSEVWQGVVVNQETVIQRVRLLREAVGDNGQDPEIIETVRGHGYRLIPAVKAVQRDKTGRAQVLHKLTQRSGLAALAVLAVATASYILWRFDAAETPQPTAIAVLPFVNLSNDAEQDYLADGLTVELTSLLSRIPEMRVSAYTSANSYRGSDRTINDVAATLDVTHVLEGSVRKSADEIRVTAQLIKADGGYNVWSDTYSRPLENVFELQDEIAASIVGAVTPKLASGPPQVPRTDAQAYSAYLKGRYFDNLKGEENWAKSAAAYRRALAIDPDYAPAWAGLALTYFYQTNNYAVDYASGVRKSRDAAERALALDPEQADALAALSLIRSTFDWDWQGAMSAIQRALDAEPRNSNVLNYAGSLATVFGYTGLAVSLFERAILLDPLNMSPQNALAIAHMNAGRLEDSKAVLESLILLNEDYPWARINLARVHLLASDPAAALQIVSASDPDLWRDYVYILANHDLGRQSRAQRMTDDFIATYGADAAIITAEILAWRGFVDDAFTWLDTAVERRNPGLIYIRDNPFFAGIRGDVRWQLLLDRLGLLDPPAWPAAGG